MTEDRPTDELSDAQEEIMQLIWEHGELTALKTAELIGLNRPVTKTTVRTLMERMVDKGWLVHRVENRTYIYSAAHPKKKAVGTALIDVLNRLCNGKPETLVSALLDEKRLTVDQLDRISEMLKQERAKRTNKRKDR